MRRRRVSGYSYVKPGSADAGPRLASLSSDYGDAWRAGVMARGYFTPQSPRTPVQRTDPAYHVSRKPAQVSLRHRGAEDDS